MLTLVVLFQYLTLARELPGYGEIVFPHCGCDSRKEGHVIVCVGANAFRLLACHTDGTLEVGYIYDLIGLCEINYMYDVISILYRKRFSQSKKQKQDGTFLHHCHFFHLNPKTNTTLLKHFTLFYCIGLDIRGFCL